MSYKDTLNLPQTDFSMQAKLKELEPKMLKFWADLDLYAALSKHTCGRPKFILHDGPPYANGDIHAGHVLNKVLKDVVIKYKAMQGFAVPYVPGWDCHGLPVEHQLFKELGISKDQIDKVEFRKKAKDFALRFVDIQRTQFQRLGLVADWQRPYLTLDPAYEAEILRVFAKLVKAGYIYHGLKPINWCISCETALAEAEVEYENHHSPSIYVKFDLPNQPGPVNDLLRAHGRESAKTAFVIWTTTPWTLVSNVAIAVHPGFKYSLFEVNRQGLQEIWIVVDTLAEQLMQTLNIQSYQKIAEIKGRQLEGLGARHPFLNRDSQLVLADYVSDQEGTGCVHTAPGHGQEDYLTGLKYKLPVIMPVDAQGRFDQSCAELSGVKVFAANELIIEKIGQNGNLLNADTTEHAYPHCWRCKTPLITRSTRQWFVNVEHKALRERALKVIKKVKWIPELGEGRISSMVADRPDWCLSRQRFWGVPIPVFYCEKCGQEILRAEIIEKVAEQVGACGSDAWFTKTVQELAGQKLRCPACQSEEFRKEEDIIDVWFDSGISHQAVLSRNKELAFPAALYLEGSDQHRGWFQTSLLTSVAITGSAPYQQVLTHGFTVDGEGKKMSKSKGNVVSPQEVISEYGAEILRLWVASCDYTDDVRISGQVLTGVADAYRKIRNTLRFFIGNLYDFTTEQSLEYNELLALDQWALSSLAGLVKEVTEGFEQYSYFKVFRRLYNFCVQEMSAFYLDVLKDRLYTFGKDSLARRSAQTVIYEILITLTKLVTPILTFTAEELWQCINKANGGQDKESVILQSWPQVNRRWINPKLDQRFTELISIRNAVLKAIENEREKGRIKSSLEAKVSLFITKAQLSQFLEANKDLLPELFIVSSVLMRQNATMPEDAFVHPENQYLGIKVERIDFPKCQRCWNYRAAVGKDAQHPQLCQRCVEVIEGRAK
ncbi:isoleucine--tRNA ligase [Candidatus Omnitrophota bacterium]